jgi:uracil phosphoribosyltransferase
VANCKTLQEQPVLVNIIRSGIPFHQGFLHMFDQADSGFIATYRHTKKSGEFEIQNKYTNTPSLENKVVILIDPMLATGRSMVMCCKDLLSEYNIKELHVASIIASEEGLQHVQAFVPEAHLWIGDTDNELTSKSLIVPGIGKVGDLAYGGLGD